MLKQFDVIDTEALQLECSGIVFSRETEVEEALECSSERSHLVGTERENNPLNC